MNTHSCVCVCVCVLSSNFKFSCDPTRWPQINQHRRRRRLIITIVVQLKAFSKHRPALKSTKHPGNSFIHSFIDCSYLFFLSGHMIFNHNRAHRIKLTIQINTTIKIYFFVRSCLRFLFECYEMQYQ